MQNIPPPVTSLTTLENANSSANRLVRSLSSLPTEILYQVLDDLSIYHTLKVCHYAIHSKANNIDPERIIYGVTTHMGWRRVFPTREHLIDCLSAFAIYESIRLVRADPKTPKDSYLSASSSTSSALVTPPFLVNRLRRDTFYYLNYINKDRLALLQPYTTAQLLSAPDFSSFAAVTARWEAIQSAQQKLNAKKCAQLLRIAKIVETYPDMVRRWNDPHKTRTGHVLERIYSAAKNVQREHIVRSARPSTSYFFKPGQLPIVPMDWCLKLFEERVQFPVKGTKMKPATEEMLESEVSVDGTSGSLGEFRISGASGDTFPTDLVRDMHTAIKGLAFVYYSPPKIVYEGEKEPNYDVPGETDAQLRRTVDSVYSAPPKNKGKREPQFRMVYYVHGYELPHDEREFEWLEAFLKCVAYLRNVQAVS